MSEPSKQERVTIDGKFFRLGSRKFFGRGVTYGPFAPGEEGIGFPNRHRVGGDFSLIQQLGANLVRVYETPPRWILDMAISRGLRLFVDLPWSKHLCFFESPEAQRTARDIALKAASACRGHPGLFAYSIGNEIPADIVRWQGARRTVQFLEELIRILRENDPGCLCTYSSFPPTEYLQVETVDFTCFNVFLHDRAAFSHYLARLQMVAGGRPLVLGECGIDSLREGERRQTEILTWQIEESFRHGLAGAIVFSFTDEWHRGGEPVSDWAFGLTTPDREPRPAYYAVQRQFREMPAMTLPRYPAVSIVVACFNGETTLRTCLESLSRLHYPDFEIILVDDGSEDRTPEIALDFPSVRYLRQDHQGLSVARNTGVEAARGEIIAFTDADCRADEDWLRYMVGDLLRSGFAGMGGHNFLPPDDSRVAAAVMASPGGPAHVMISDRVAEHVPGCNMVFWKRSLAEVGGFDPSFHKAGDDVDLCWRIQQMGRTIGFSSAGFVWHYRRSTIRAYLRQQAGYGDAEAMLARKHPEQYNIFGGGRWRGRIYGAGDTGVRLHAPVIYHGPFGTGAFQRVYLNGNNVVGGLFNSFEYHAFLTAPLFALSWAFPVLLPFAGACAAMSLLVASLAGAQANLPAGKRTFWSRPLVALLHLLQPLVRGWARYRWRFLLRSLRPTTFRRVHTAPTRWQGDPSLSFAYWTGQGGERIEWLKQATDQLQSEGWQLRTDTGWAEFDIEIWGRRWSRIRMITALEDLGHRRRVLRVRLVSAWSLTARWSFGLFAGIAASVIAGTLQGNPWRFLSLLVLPLLAFFVEKERRQVLQLIRASLDDFARATGWAPLSATPPAAAEDSPVNVRP